MKSILMALVLMMSVSAQARINWHTTQSEDNNVGVENIQLDAHGTVLLTTNRHQKIEFSKNLFESMGMSTADFIELVKKYNKSTTEAVTFNLRFNPDLRTVGRLSIEFPQ